MAEKLPKKKRQNMQYFATRKIVIFLIFWCRFCQEYGRRRKNLFEQWQKLLTLREKNIFAMCKMTQIIAETTDQNSSDQKWSKKMTIEMADKIDMTKNVRQNWSDKNKWQTNDTQNDRQSWNDKQITTGMAKIWQIRYFEFFNLCLHKFLLTLRMSNLCEVDVGPFTKTRLKYGWGCTPWLAGCVPAVAHCQHVAAEKEGKNLWASAGD